MSPKAGRPLAHAGKPWALTWGEEVIPLLPRQKQQETDYQTKPFEKPTEFKVDPLWADWHGRAPHDDKL